MSGIVEGTSRRAPMRLRIANKRVLALVKAFVKAGILRHDGACATRPGGCRKVGFFPVLAQPALSGLDEHIAQMPGGPDSSQQRRLS
jgi:RNA-directed DNA polymerase